MIIFILINFLIYFLISEIGEIDISQSHLICIQMKIRFELSRRTYIFPFHHKNSSCRCIVVTGRDWAHEYFLIPLPFLSHNIMIWLSFTASCINNPRYAIHTLFHLSLSGKFHRSFSLSTAQAVEIKFVYDMLLLRIYFLNCRVGLKTE